MNPDKLSYGASCYIYNITRKRFLHVNPQIYSKNTQYNHVAKLVSSPLEASLFILRPLVHKLLNETIPTTNQYNDTTTGRFYIQAADNHIGDNMYMSVLTDDDTVFTKPLNTSIWITHVTRHTPSFAKHAIYFNVPYFIMNSHLGKYIGLDLNGMDVSTNNVYTSLDDPDNYNDPDAFLFIPHTPQYICEKTVNTCAATQGKQNALEPIICQTETKDESTPSTCRNILGEAAFFNQDQCNTHCSARLDLYARATPAIVKDNVQYQTVKYEKKNYIIIIICIVSAILILLFLYSSSVK